MARDVGAHVLPRGDGCHVVVVFYHTYYKRKIRAVIASSTENPWRPGAWSSSSWMRFGPGGGGSGGGEVVLAHGGAVMLACGEDAVVFLADAVVFVADAVVFAVVFVSVFVV